MSWQCTSWALREAPAPTATARLVLIALADRCQPDGRSAWPTVETLMAEAHTSESSVKRALKALEETGCIRRGNQKLAQWDEHGNYVPDPCFASMFVRQVRQCFSAVWADGFPRCRHRFPVM